MTDTKKKEYRYEDFYDCVFRKRMKVQAKIKAGRITYDEKDEFFKNPQYHIELVDVRDCKTGDLLRDYLVLEADKRIRNKYFKVGQYITFYAFVKKFKRTRVPDPTSLYAMWEENMTYINGCQGLAVMNKQEAENNVKRGKNSTTSKNVNLKVRE